MPKSTLLVAFETLVDQFNKCGKQGDYRTNLRPLLHPNAIISKVDDTTPPTSFETADAVIQYLEDKQAKTNKFPRFKQSTVEETPSDSSNATLAQVTGLARYKDTKDTPDAGDLKVRYFFTFAREKAGDAWLLLNASTPESP